MAAEHTQSPACLAALLAPQTTCTLMWQHAVSKWLVLGQVLLLPLWMQHAAAAVT